MRAPRLALWRLTHAVLRGTEGPGKRRQTARLRLRQHCATPADRRRIAEHHGRSCLPGATDSEGTEATERMERMEMGGECHRWTWGGSKCLALRKQRLCGTKRTNPRRHCKSGGCQQGRHHGDAAASREPAKEYECWGAGSCKGCDSRQNRDSETGCLCKGTCPRPR